MTENRVYDLAFRYKKSKLWKKLYDTQLYALRHADGSISYCCVMGRGGNFTALAVYPGAKGLDSYRRMGGRYYDMDEFEKNEMLLSQDCMMCSFEGKDDLHPLVLDKVRAYCVDHNINLRGKNAYPNLIRHELPYYPWPITDEAEFEKLADALEAGEEIASKLETSAPRQLGFTEGPPFDRSIPLLEKQGETYSWTTIPLPEPLEEEYPAPKTPDEFTLARLKRSVKNEGTWGCEVLLSMEPVGDDDIMTSLEKRPFFPWLLLMADCDSSMLISMNISQNAGSYADQFAQIVMKAAESSAPPQTIQVSSLRALSLFAPLAEIMGADIIYVEEIPALDDAKDIYLKNVALNKDGVDEDLMAMNDDEVLNQLTAIITNKDALRKMSDEVLEHLVKAAALGAFPKDLSDRLIKELKRRG